MSCSSCKSELISYHKKYSEVCASCHISLSKSELKFWKLNFSWNWKLLQWDSLSLLLWKYVTWLWHLFHWYLQGQSGSWFNFHNSTWNPLKLQQPGPACLLCCPAVLQSCLQLSCWWAPIPSPLLLCWSLVKCLQGQLFTSVPATEIFPCSMKGFLESFCTVAVLYARHIPQGSGGGSVRISFEVFSPSAKTRSQNRIFLL